MAPILYIWESLRYHSFMSTKHHLRHERTCLNCGHWVEERFCSRCGQENTDSRQTFRHLIGHFFEDLTHYEGKFWITMRYLLFRPAYLSKQFLQGKRSKYVLPVRLYIFISFVTFLLPHLLPEAEAPETTVHSTELNQQEQTRNSNMGVVAIGDNFGITVPKHYENVHELDSIQQSLPPGQRMGFFEHWLEKRYIHLHTKSPVELWEKFSESFARSFPKTLFAFMPLFALVLWLFHGKKRWLYFDHAIFTLHYFSFMLLLNDLSAILLTVFDFTVDYDTSSAIGFIGILVLVVSFLVYFYIAHQKMYEESVGISLLKSTLILGITIFLFVALMILMSIYTVLMIH